MYRISTLVLFLYAALLPLATLAEPAPLRLTGSLGTESLAGHIEVHRDPGHALTAEAAAALARAGGFDPLPGNEVNFDYTPDAIWLHFRLTNATEATRDWRLHFRENFFQAFDVFRIGPAGIETLIHQDTGTGFHTRPVPYPELVAPLVLPPGETADLFVRYYSGGSSQLTFRIFTAADFETFAQSQTARNFIFYGMLLLLNIAALVAFVVSGHGIFAAYSAYATSGLLFVMHGDGNAFRYIWPDAPGFNASASMVLGTALIVAGGQFARMFLQTARHHPVFDRLLIGTILVALGLFLASSFADNQALKKLMVLCAFVSILLYTAAGLNAARTRFREVRFYVLAWTGALLSSAIMTARHWVGIEISEEAQYDSMRAVLVLDAALMGLAIFDRINQLRRRHQAALSLSLAEARRNLDLTVRLKELEEQVALTERLSQSRRQEVADTIHDLRQPLHALRLSVRNLLDGTRRSPREQKELDASFGYLEQLVGQRLAQQAAGAPQTAALPPAPADVAATLQRAARMFAPEAAAKDLRLTVVPSTAATVLSPLDLMRLVTNLLANAIKYTQEGRILVGVRHCGGGARLEVHDTGPGLTPADFARAVGRSVRLDGAGTAEGSGLGLAIIAGICRDNGLEFGLVPGRRGGTGIWVGIS